MLISVCMATYNGAGFLKEQVDSILQQEFHVLQNIELEIVVSDDQSYDDTVQILESYGDTRIRIVHHTPLHAHRYYKSLFFASQNFENAIRNAKGEYIFLSDQDDIWYPDHIETLLLAMKDGKRMAVSSFDRISQKGRYLCTTPCQEVSVWKMFRKFPYFGFTMAFHHSLLHSFLPFPDVPQHDIFMGLVAKQKRELMVVSSPVTSAHRQLKGMVNTSYTGFNVPFLVKIIYRVKMIFYSWLRSFK